MERRMCAVCACGGSIETEDSKAKQVGKRGALCSRLNGWTIEQIGY